MILEIQISGKPVFVDWDTFLHAQFYTETLVLTFVKDGKSFEISIPAGSEQDDMLVMLTNVSEPIKTAKKRKAK